MQQPKYCEELADVMCAFLNQRKYPVCIIYGNPDTGKTDTACLIAEIGLDTKTVDYFASNINTKGMGEKITSLEEVKYWHRHQTGKKLYILDEAGVNDDCRSPLSKLNREIRHEIFIARKFFVHWVFVLQELKDIDNWKNSELTGMKILKNSNGTDFKGDIKLKWYENKIPYQPFPRTRVPFDTLDIGLFTLEHQLNDDDVTLRGLPAQVAQLYASGGNFAVICRTLKEKTNIDYKVQQVKRLLQQYLKQSLRNQDSPPKTEVI